MKINRRDFLVAGSAAGILAKTGLPAFAAGNKTEAKTAKTFADKKVAVFTTADKTKLRMSPTETLSFKPLEQPLETQICVFVEPKRKFQTFLGIGGALTDSSAETFAKLPKAKQEEFLTAYFDKDKGIGYTFGRTNIHSCDFSSGSYTYVDEGDKDLKTFNVEHDRKFRIPFIKQAIARAGGKLTMFASPWSPPAFMKTTNNMLKGGKLKPEFAASWAMYYAKFIKAYEQEGIPVWGIPCRTSRWRRRLGNRAFTRRKTNAIFSKIISDRQ